MKVPHGVKFDRDPGIMSLEDSVNRLFDVIVGDQKEELPPSPEINHIGPEEAIKELLALENATNVTQNLTADDLGSTEFE